jgi:hypothetical protein
MYKSINKETIQRLADGVYIPCDEANADFQCFLEWEKCGGELLEADPAPVYVPQEVSAAQAYVALMAAGLYEEVEAWANDPNTSYLHRIAFQKGATFRRDSPAVLAGAAVLRWEGALLDQLFIAADAIKL